MQISCWLAKHKQMKQFKLEVICALTLFSKFDTLIREEIITMDKFMVLTLTGKQREYI